MRSRLIRKLSFLILLLWFLTGCNAALAEEPVHTEDIDEISEELTIHFLDVGQGDCTIITHGKYSMLIDAGTKNQGSKIRCILTSLGIDALDHVILTHPDNDHIGGADEILQAFDCETSMLHTGDTFSLGEASFTVLAPTKNYDDNNNNSIVLKLTHGENTFLFTGDAEKEAEKDMLSLNLDLSADVLKVGHHGSSDSTSEDFLRAVNPSYAVISCGQNNDYGHPHKETLERLYQSDTMIYRTDEQGTITVTSDGKELIWNTHTDLTAGMEITYYLNTRSMKIHLPDCESVQKMADHNRAASYDTKEVLMNLGYEPCGQCKP